MAEIRINATGGVKLYDADDSHYAQIVAGTITSNVNAITLGHDVVSIVDNLALTSDSAVLKFGADGDTTLTHTDGTGLTLNSTNKLCFNDASQFVQGSSATVISIGATDEIDLTATAVDLNGTLDVSGTSQFNAAVTLAGTTPSLTIGDAGAEDAKIVFDGNAQDFHIGLDDSADDLVIGLGSALGTTSHIVCDEAGHVTMPLQSCCSVYLSATQDNFANDGGAAEKIEFDSERFDVNADFNTGTFLYTAPVTGKYIVQYQLRLNNLDTAANFYQGYIITSNISYQIIYDPGGLAADINYFDFGGGMLVDLDAGDTCYLTLSQHLGTSQTDVAGGDGVSTFSVGLFA